MPAPASARVPPAEGRPPDLDRWAARSLGAGDGPSALAQPPARLADLRLHERPRDAARRRPCSGCASTSSASCARPSWSACRWRTTPSRSRTRSCATVRAQPGRDRREGERLPALDRGRRGAARRARRGGDRRLRPGRRHHRAQGREAALQPGAAALDREGAAQPPPRHRAAAGQGRRQLHLADVRQVARAPRAATTRSCSSTRTATSPRAPTTNVFLVDAAGVVRTPPEEKVLLGVTRRSILEIAKHDGLPSRESKVRPEAAVRGARGVPHRHHRGRVAGGEHRRPPDRRRRARAGERAPARRASSGRRGRRARFAHWLTLVGPALGACASSPGIQPSASHLHIGNYFGALRQHVALQEQHEALYFIADYHSMTSVRDARRAPRATRSRWRSTTSPAGSTRSARSCSASPTCPRSASWPGCSRR